MNDSTMKPIRTFLILLLAIFSSRCALANLAGPYTPDANTLFLLHFDEAAGGSVSTNLGSKGGNFISVNFSSSASVPVVTTMLGGVSYSSNAPANINFNHCDTNLTTGYLWGYDYNRDGTFEADNSAVTADFLGMTNLGIGVGGQSPFTLEAIIRPTSTAGNQEIICTDSSQASRGFQFRISAGTLQFQFITGGQSLNPTIPTTGPNAFVANSWYHVAFTYNGTIGTVYWTKLDPSVGAANVLTSGPMTMGTADGAVVGTLGIGNRGRPSGSETFLGNIDEVRISNVARAANQMQFFSPLVTITQNPISQNVDYNQPVTFSVGATTTGSTLGYQWLFNSNGIAGATNATLTIPHVAAANAGYYDCLVTNTLGYSATSSVARLVVGAANFLVHRYSFLTNANDSIGTANGTLFGDATATNGGLTLDGTTGTYMQLPANIVNGTSQTAFTVESWATYGVNPANVYLFNFGYTNNIEAHAYLGYSPHNASGNEVFIASGDAGIFNQTAAGPATLDGLSIHVACVYDPPNQTMAIYTNGVLEAINTNMTVGLANIDDVFSYIGASLVPSDPYLVANINELRLYSGALSPLSLAQSDVLGPTQVLADGPATFVRQPVSSSTPVGQTATFTAAAIGYLPIDYQWFKNGTLVPGATNSTDSFTASLADNNDSFICYATNIIGVTTYITNSTSVTLSVFVPPTLAWLGAADGGADNNWNTASLDWTNDALGGGAIAFSQTNGVLFDDRSGGGTVDLEQTIIPYNINVNAAAGYTLSSSGNQGSLAGLGVLTKQNSGTLIVDLTNNMNGPTIISGGILQIGNSDSFGTLGHGPVTNSATLSINRSDTVLNIPNSIHGSGTLSFDGGGAVTLSGNSDFTGSTLVNEGIVYLTSATGLGSTSTGTLVANGAQLYATANVDCSEPLTLNGAGDSNGALRKGGAGTTTEWGTVSLGSAATIGVDSGATLVLSNAVSGAASLTAVGSGTLTLDANSTFNGGFVLNGPLVNVGTAGALGSGTVSINGNGRFVIANGLNVANFFQASAVSPGSGTGLLAVNDNTNGIVTTISGPVEFDTSPASGGDFLGPISSGYLNVTGPITNLATGVVSTRLGSVRFSGGGNYTLFDLTGTVSLGANNGLCTAASLAMCVSGAGVFDMNGFSQELTGFADGATPINSELVTNSSASPSTLTLDLVNSGVYSGVIAGNIALVENGTGYLDLAGTNAYTGNTTVNGGTLEMAQPGLAAGSTVTVAGGAILQLDFAVTNQVSALVTNGISAGAGLYSSANASPYLAGSGYLLVKPGPSGPAHLTTSVSGTASSLSWPAGQGWRLVSQTNSLSTGLNPNPAAWSSVPGAGNGSATITIDPSKPAVFYQLVYP